MCCCLPWHFTAFVRWLWYRRRYGSQFQWLLFTLLSGLTMQGQVITTIGFLKEAPHVCVHGFNVYHKNRLILVGVFCKRFCHMFLFYASQKTICRWCWYLCLCFAAKYCCIWIKVILHCFNLSYLRGRRMPISTCDNLYLKVWKHSLHNSCFELLVHCRK